MPLTEDLSVFLNDFGVTATSGAISGLGILDMPGQLIADGMVISTDYTLRCESAKFGGLLYGDEMRISGVTYQVREVRLIDDGTLCDVALMRLDPGVSAAGRDPRQGLLLSDLGDVEVSNLQAGDLLVNDGSAWVNTPDVEGGGA